MTLLERYILKISFTAFAACLVALTAVIWITQALRELDLLTGKGQTHLHLFDGHRPVPAGPDQRHLARSPSSLRPSTR